MADGEKKNQCNLTVKWAQCVGHSALWSLVQIAETKIAQWQMVWIAWLSSGRMTGLLAPSTEALQNNHCGEATAVPFAFPGSFLTNAAGMFSGRGNHLCSSRHVHRKRWVVGLVQHLQPRTSDATNSCFWMRGQEYDFPNVSLPTRRKEG